MYMNEIKNFFSEDDGIGVVEIILILMVLVGLVVLFKKEITGLIKDILSKATSQAKDL